MSAPTFPQLGVQPWLVKQCGVMQINSPTEVQQQCIPAVLRGMNVLGGAITGSGKTAAFALPILQQLSEEVYGVFAIVMTPSRELAYQINDQFVAFGSPINVRTLVAIGGINHGTQVDVFKQRPHIVIATPGRLRMILENFPEAVATLKHLRYLVLDEADRLTEGDMSVDTLEAIQLLGKPKSNRRTLLFTATINNSLTKVEEGLLPRLGISDPGNFKLCLTTVASSTVTNGKKKKNSGGAEDESDEEEGGDDQPGNDGRGGEAESIGMFHIPAKLKSHYIFLPMFVKMSYLVTLLRARLNTAGSGGQSSKKQQKEGGNEVKKESVIIFVNSCMRCEVVRLSLQMLGFPVGSLNSLLTQQQRLNNLSMFKAGITRYLVATDIAARGLDIPDVDLVVHYDFPKMSATYVHRVGRTARAGREGESIALVTEADVFLVHKVERRTKKKLSEYRHPKLNDDEVCKVLDEVSVAKVDATLNVEERSGDRVRQNKEVAAERRGEINHLIRTDGLSQMKAKGIQVAVKQKESENGGDENDSRFSGEKRRKAIAPSAENEEPPQKRSRKVSPAAKKRAKLSSS